jgi:uncharacterized NAD(P)/FAD-binding protein YdhS
VKDQTQAGRGPAHVAIVGCGFTGTSALLQLIDRCPVRRITVFEATGDFGPGFAYRRDDSPAYLLNNTTDSLCLLPHNRQAFIAWLQGQGEAPDAKDHLSRGRYGDFLAEAVRAAAMLAAAKGIVLQRLPHAVTGLDEPAPADGGGVRLHWAGGCLAADAVILATGRCPPRQDIAPPPPGSGAQLVASHVRDTTLDSLPLDARCHVLGASLSAYDVVNRLFAPSTGCRFERDADGTLRYLPGPNRRQVLLCSRSGRLKQVQSPQPMALQPRHLTRATLDDLAARGQLTLAALRALVDAEASDQGLALDWPALLAPYAGCRDTGAVQQRAIDQLAGALAAANAGRNLLVDLAGATQTLLWDAFADRLLPAAEERRYCQQVETAVLTCTAPSALPTAERLLALLRAGAVQVRHGVQGVAWSDADAAWHIPCAFGVELARVLIDCRGALDRRVDSAAQPPLVRDMAARGMLRPYQRDGEPADGAAIDMATLRAEGSRHVHVAGMWLWGPGIFTSSAFMMARAVQTILAALYPGAVERPVSR